MEVTTQAMGEIARFLVSQPSPEQIMAFHASPQVAACLYALIGAEHDGPITDAERRELDAFETIEHFIIHLKAEACRKLGQQ